MQKAQTPNRHPPSTPEHQISFLSYIILEKKNQIFCMLKPNPNPNPQFRNPTTTRKKKTNETSPLLSEGRNSMAQTPQQQAADRTRKTRAPELRGGPKCETRPGCGRDPSAQSTGNWVKDDLPECERRGRRRGARVSRRREGRRGRGVAKV